MDLAGEILHATDIIRKLIKSKRASDKEDEKEGKSDLDWRHPLLRASRAC